MVYESGRFVIIAVENEFLEDISESCGCPKDKIPLLPVQKNGRVLYATSSQSEFRDKFQFFFDRYTSAIMSVVGYDSESGARIEI